MMPYLLAGPAPSSTTGTTKVYRYFDRDLSWLAFNERVLMEAGSISVPLLERLNFLAIFSSNLDEFYRVRMPAITAIHKLFKKDKVNDAERQEYQDTAKFAAKLIAEQLNLYGKTLRSILDELKKFQVQVLYGDSIPDRIRPQLRHYFFTQILAFLQPASITDTSEYQPENNQLYFAITGKKAHEDHPIPIFILKLPTEHLPRFFSTVENGVQYIVFMDDIIQLHLDAVVGFSPVGSYTFKITRDAELHLEDIYEEDMAAKIEKQISKRDFGLATRLLHDPETPAEVLNTLISAFGLPKSVLVSGGKYHALKDLSELPVHLPELKFKPWPAQQIKIPDGSSLLNEVLLNDVLLHPPYHSYDTVLRFFNEAAIHQDVTAIWLTMYRVASDSKILHALLSAAKNGKQVTVLVELKARFDEGNNIKWAKQLRKAGVKVLYTREDLKVHAKTALIRFRSKGNRPEYAGLLATGNLNESTARFYTDHILLTADRALLKELQQLFDYFSNGTEIHDIRFEQLLVAQFNLQERFLELIDREIVHAQQGLPAAITIKMNNLEERVLINKLYEASNAGVEIRLIIRGICCLVPGIDGQSKNITVRRIVDRYLEHGRIFIFQNAGDKKIFLGSADWMNRNIYRRVEVCFPIKDKQLKQQMAELVDIQWMDDTASVELTEKSLNSPVTNGSKLRSQTEIYRRISITV